MTSISSNISNTMNLGRLELDIVYIIVSNIAPSVPEIPTGYLFLFIIHQN